MPCRPLTARVGGAVAGSQHAGGPAGAPRKQEVRPPYNGPVSGAGAGARPGQGGGWACQDRTHSGLGGGGNLRKKQRQHRQGQDRHLLPAPRRPNRQKEQLEGQD